VVARRDDPRPRGPDDDRIELLLVDGQAMFREGLRALADQEPDLVVVGTCGGAPLRSVYDGVPDVVVTDVELPEARDADAVGLVREELPGSRLLVLTHVDHPKRVERVLKAGADGYISKAVPASELFSAIRTVARGEPYLQSALGVAIARAQIAAGSRPSGPLGELSVREAEVLRLLAMGNTNREVAELFGVSLRTIEALRASVVHKTGLHTRAELVLHAHALGIDDLPG
jgi:two-component system, NarL family, response regulator NreC